MNTFSVDSKLESTFYLEFQCFFSLFFCFFQFQRLLCVTCFPVAAALFLLWVCVCIHTSFRCLLIFSPAPRGIPSLWTGTTETPTASSSCTTWPTQSPLSTSSAGSMRSRRTATTSPRSWASPVFIVLFLHRISCLQTLLGVHAFRRSNHFVATHKIVVCRFSFFCCCNFAQITRFCWLLSLYILSVLVNIRCFFVTFV